MKLFGFLFKIAVLAALVIWLADRPGTAHIEWRDTVIEMTAAVLAVIVVALMYASFLVHRLWRMIWDGPRFWLLNRKIGKMEEGQSELAKGLSAIAGGEAAEAGKHAVKARKLLGELPTTRLLQAQAAQLAGDHVMAKSLYEAMTADPDTAMLGYRGLIMAALRAGDFDEAGRLATRLEAAKGEVPWLNVVRFEIGARLQNWSKAEAFLTKARKAKAIPSKQADKHEAVMLLAEAKNALRESNPKLALEKAERAKKLAPDWVPATLVLAEAQIVTGHEGAALRTLSRAWDKAPHAQITPLVHWATRSAKSIDGYKQIEKLTRSTRENPDSLRALADAALRADLWGEARRFLMTLVGRGEATQLTYQMLARLERRENRNEAAAAGWLAKAVLAPPDAQWLCRSCGAAHEYWEATCPFCGTFASLEWGVPGKGRLATGPTEPPHGVGLLG